MIEKQKLFEIDTLNSHAESKRPSWQNGQNEWLVKELTPHRFDQCPPSEARCCLESENTALRRIVEGGHLKYSSLPPRKTSKEYS
jgi:hypothetical protein